jgi:3-hydroxybutyryl-CoA dehydrogenase
VKTSPLKVGVIGAGTMGAGIATVVARAGHHTILRDLDTASVESGISHVTKFLDKSVELGKLGADAAAQAKGNLLGTTSDDDLADADIVIEAVFESLELKQQLFERLSVVCSRKTLFHTNTSTLSVTAIAAGSVHPDRVVGTHYCNPAPLMKLVEVVKGQRTSVDAYDRTVDFMRSLGKVTVTTDDVPGFIVNRFLIPFENNCIRALEAGVGTVDVIRWDPSPFSTSSDSTCTVPSL